MTKLVFAVLIRLSDRWSRRQFSEIEQRLSIPVEKLTEVLNEKLAFFKKRQKIHDDLQVQNSW